MKVHKRAPGEYTISLKGKRKRPKKYDCLYCEGDHRSSRCPNAKHPFVPFIVWAACDIDDDRLHGHWMRRSSGTSHPTQLCDVNIMLADPQWWADEKYMAGSPNSQPQPTVKCEACLFILADIISRAMATFDKECGALSPDGTMRCRRAPHLYATDDDGVHIGEKDESSLWWFDDDPRYPDAPTFDEEANHGEQEESEDGEAEEAAEPGVLHRGRGRRALGSLEQAEDGQGAPGARGSRRGAVRPLRAETPLGSLTLGELLDTLSGARAYTQPRLTPEVSPEEGNPTPQPLGPAVLPDAGPSPFAKGARGPLAVECPECTQPPGAPCRQVPQNKRALLGRVRPFHRRRVGHSKWADKVDKTRKQWRPSDG